MSFEDPQPVSGTLELRHPDGTTEIIDMTVEEVRNASKVYLQSDCARIRVLFDDGEIRRPYRFVDTQPFVRTGVDPETGEAWVAY